MGNQSSAKAKVREATRRLGAAKVGVILETSRAAVLSYNSDCERQATGELIENRADRLDAYLVDPSKGAA